MNRPRIKMLPIRSSNPNKKTFIKTLTQLKVETMKRELRTYKRNMSVWDKILADVAKL